MGTYVEGEASFTFSRELADDELGRWEHDCTTGKRAENDIPMVECWRCHGSGRSAPYKWETEVEVDDHGQAVCSTCEGHGERRDWDSSYFDAEQWDFTGETWGDIGIAELARNGFTIRSGGKVYDIADAARYFTERLPADVQVKGFGSFTSDGEPWTIWALNSRTIIEDNLMELPGAMWERLLKDCENADTIAILKTLTDIMEVLRG